ncbi:MAG: TIGR03088 family PEP-CTERM/XrtA system glycosyltransferase [Betaproteobacteria bacterium]|nr:TIGR03088 family PEP-CTERM/XrtA system glycosyltransferase [Betaproteobacteria bacterium]
MNDPRPLIAHVIHHFGTGGMENGMVMLFNHLPEEKYRHAVINLAGYGEFRHRIRRADISFHDLGKQAGRDVSWHVRLNRLLKELRPDILHTRNLSALEAQFTGAWRGIRGRVHGEHGRDIYDLHGKNWKYNLLRRAARHAVHRYIAVSRDLEQWLHHDIGVPPQRVRQIYNGVDGARFHPRAEERPDLGRPDFFAGAECVFGTVGRLAAVKDYPTLVRAFALLCRQHPNPAGLRLVLVGDGPQRGQVEAAIHETGLTNAQVWLPGDRKDIADWLRALDVFCLTSLGEGISNTILESMASGLPVVATQVGGTPELIEAGVNGSLIPAGDAQTLAATLAGYALDPERRRREGLAARARIERDFVIERMAAQYAAVYDELLQR